MYEIKVDRKAAKFIAAQSKNVQRQIVSKIRSLAKDPRPQNCKQLKGMDGVYRIRSGDYRIIYQVIDKQLIVLVVRVGHRKDIYKRL